MNHINVKYHICRFSQLVISGPATIVLIGFYSGKTLNYYLGVISIVVLLISLYISICVKKFKPNYWFFPAIVIIIFMIISIAID